MSYLQLTLKWFCNHFRDGETEKQVGQIVTTVDTRRIKKVFLPFSFSLSA